MTRPDELRDSELQKEIARIVSLICNEALHGQTDEVTEASYVRQINAWIDQQVAATTAAHKKTLEEKDQAYSERNKIVAYLSKQYPSHLSHHGEDPNWDKDWLNIVCIHSPAGQLTWHIHDSEVGLFSHLTLGENHWDGHSTEEKYKRLARLEPKSAEEGK